MDQDETWVQLGLGHGHGHIVLDVDPTPSPKKGAQPPMFGRCPLWPNGWMDQGVTWYEGRPRPRQLCVRWGPSYPLQKRAQPPTQFSAHVYCSQMAGWMEMQLGTEVDNGPGHNVLDGVPALRERGTAAPLFGTCLLWPWSPISAIAELLLRLGIFLAVSIFYCIITTTAKIILIRSQLFVYVLICHHVLADTNCLLLTLYGGPAAAV